MNSQVFTAMFACALLAGPSLANAQANSRQPQNQQWLELGGKAYSARITGGGLKDTLVDAVANGRGFLVGHAAGHPVANRLLIEVEPGRSDGLDTLLVGAFLRGQALTGAVVDAARTDFSNAIVTAVESGGYDSAMNSKCWLRFELRPGTASIASSSNPASSSTAYPTVPHCNLTDSNVSIADLPKVLVARLSGIRMSRSSSTAPIELALVKMNVRYARADDLIDWYNQSARQPLNPPTHALTYTLSGPQAAVASWQADSAALLSLRADTLELEAEVYVHGWRYQLGAPARTAASASAASPRSSQPPSNSSANIDSTVVAASTFQATVATGTSTTLHAGSFCKEITPLMFSFQAQDQRWITTIGIAGFPKPGKYEIGDDEGQFKLTLVDHFNSDELTAYEPIDGVVNITASSRDRVTGTFRYRATVKDKSGEERETTVSGSFDARGKVCE